MNVVKLLDPDAGTDWRAGWREGGGVQDASLIRVGDRRALEVRVAQGQHQGVSLWHLFAPNEPEEAYMRYEVRFNDSWRGGARDGQIGKLPGFAAEYGRCGSGGRRSDGSCWSARMMNFDRGDRQQVGFYVYHVDQETNTGDHMFWPLLLQRERWYTIDQRVKLNTPGVKDGILQGWVDGSLVFERRDVRFRSVPGVKIEKAWLHVYVGGDWVADRNMRIHFGPMTVVAARIGETLPPPEVVMPPPGSLVAGLVWQAKGFPLQDRVFAVEFDLIPAAAGMDGVTGLSAGAAAAYTDLAAIVRFNIAGQIDARNGDRYQALTPMPYAPGNRYRVRMVVDVPARTYSVWVDGQRLAADYAFRTEQAAVGALDTLNVYASIGSHRVQGFVGMSLWR